MFPGIRTAKLQNNEESEKKQFEGSGLKHMRNIAKLLVLLGIAVVALNGLMHERVFTAGAQSVTTVENLTFHYYSVIQKADNGSFTIYDGADTKGPQQTTAFQTNVNSQIQGQTTFLGIQWTYWDGIVGWGYQLTDDVHVQGTVQITVYMSSSDTISGLISGAGYAFGLSDVDPNGNEIKQFEVDGPQSIESNPLTSSPKAYTLSVQVDYIFPKGDAIVFFAGAGATKQGFKFTVYFDSPDKNSGAALPVVTQTSTPSPSPSPSPTSSPSPTLSPTATPSPSSKTSSSPAQTPTFYSPSPSTGTSPSLSPTSSSSPSQSPNPPPSPGESTSSFPTPKLSTSPVTSPFFTGSPSSSPKPSDSTIPPTANPSGASTRISIANEIYYSALLVSGVVVIILVLTLFFRKRVKWRQS